jgi:hypothetical protein
MESLRCGERAPVGTPGRHPISILLHVATTPRVFADAGFLEDDFQRTEVRKGRLQQVEANECREPEPVMAVEMGEREAEQDKYSGEAADDHMHFHKSVSASD